MNWSRLLSSCALVWLVACGSVPPTSSTPVPAQPTPTPPPTQTPAPLATSKAPSALTETLPPAPTETLAAPVPTETPPAAASAPNPKPPTAPVRLIFIHHSVGENWLADDNGGLGIALRDNNYFISDTNYGWGPADTDVDSEQIGDHTDIGQYWNWFRGPHRDTYLAALYAESEQHASYSRLSTNPGGENQIILFKSCFPNSSIAGSPDDPPAGADNPLRGEGSGSENQTVANVKGIYNDLLAYFATRLDKLFVLIVSPPLSSESTDAQHAANARAVANWLVNDWLANYPYPNVAVFDLFNVLTTNGGSVDVNDLNQDSGNHHRWWQDAIQHKNDADSNFLAYWSGDDHPSAAGGQKATGEFVSLLNLFYNRWHAGTAREEPSTTAPASASAEPSAVLAVPATPASASLYVLDRATVFPYPAYATPAKGTAVTDPTFHTTFQRITQQSVDGYASPAITPEYSKADPSNADGTRVLLRGVDALWYLYDSSTFALLNDGPIPGLPQDEIEPRWDANDPNVFYYRQSDDMIFRSFDVSTNTSAVVHDFSGEVPGGVTILNDSEGDSSADSQYWAFEVRGDPPDAEHILAILTYDRVADRVIGKLMIPPGGLMPNWVGIDASGTHVIFPPEDGVHPLVAYHLDFSHAVSITVSAGHSDLALDRQGRDVLVYQDNATDTISMADLETGQVTPLLPIPFDVNPDIGIHISGNNVRRPGWVLVTTGGSSYASWMDRQFWLLELRPDPRVWRLGWTRLAQCATASDFNYFAEGWATINKAGTLLWWQSNADVPACDGDNEDVYQMALPAFPE